MQRPERFETQIIEFAPGRLLPATKGRRAVIEYERPIIDSYPVSSAAIGSRFNVPSAQQLVVEHSGMSRRIIRQAPKFAVAQLLIKSRCLKTECLQPDTYAVLFLRAANISAIVSAYTVISEGH